MGRKGILRLKVDIKGKSAHSGMNYSQGISAIKEAAHKIIEIEKQSCEQETTFNCGTIEGGEVENIVPDKCSFKVDIRFIKKEALDKAIEYINAIVNKSYIEGTSSTFTEISRRLPMECTADNIKLFKRIEKACKKYNLERVKQSYSGGGSDAAYTVLAGVPSVCSVGAIGEGVHTINERADISSLASRAKMLAATIMEFPNKIYKL